MLLLREVYKPVSQSCAVAKSEKFWRATGQSNLSYKLPAIKKKFQSLVSVLKQLHFGQWPESSILSAKFDCPVAPQKFFTFSNCA